MTFDGAPFVREIKVDVKGQFSIALPAAVVAAGFESPVRAETKDKVIRAFNDAIAAYRAAATTSKRVIVFQFRANAYIFGSDDCCVLRRNDISFCQGTALALSVEVFEELETKKADGSKSYRYEPVDSSIPRGLRFNNRHAPVRQTGYRADNRIEWSVEAEAFFAKIGRSLETLMLTLDSGFKSDGSVEKLIERGFAGFLQ